MTPRASTGPRAWIWTLAAATAGFGASFTLSAILRWPRPRFVAGHAVIVLLVLLAYRHWGRVSLGAQFARRWRAGAVVGAAFGAMLVRQVLSQPASARPDGLPLVGALAWEGLVYGAADAMLLSVIPVLSLYGARTAQDLATAAGRARWALLALGGSAATAALYHAGFAEFRGAALLQPVLGTVVITLSYLLAGSPVAPLVAHVMMHFAAILHGANGTVQLPPHY